MGRTSLRNFLTAFRAIRVDDAIRGPEVSDNVQMVYIVDDLRQITNIDAGAGGQEAAVVGEHGFLALECLVAQGIEVIQVTMSLQTPADGTDIRLWTAATLPTVTGAANMLTTLRTTGLQGLPAAPLSISLRATIATAAIPAATFRMVDSQGFVPPFFLNNGQFFNVAFGTANTAVNLGIRWRELRLYQS